MSTNILALCKGSCFLCLMTGSVAKRACLAGSRLVLRTTLDRLTGIQLGPSYFTCFPNATFGQGLAGFLASNKGSGVLWIETTASTNKDVWLATDRAGGTLEARLLRFLAWLLGEKVDWCVICLFFLLIAGKMLRDGPNDAKEKKKKKKKEEEEEEDEKEKKVSVCLLIPGAFVGLAFGGGEGNFFLIVQF